MQTKIALIGIIVEEPGSVEKTNNLLHEYSRYIVGRMGLPYREKGISIISIVLDAPQSELSALAGRLGQIGGISVKTMTAKTANLE
ncbi:TM1266 family iron-only hydrogenase system putative regulator [Harryflintia acetispora]|uniref:Iron-only hydrogenase system regulator n=1 Tax=Harryflintia acetispora TaxID=1849041 RepID=A0A9X8UJR3_9FIRM|nr:TM1266 family iron-only hydrogenase system putative regulator [Harryflintia acetispora]TCL44014.1 putative iron-only hydrogenase system regulator [Harryflintia acetispora]